MLPPIRARLAVLAALLPLATSTPAAAAVQFFVNDPAGFTAATAGSPLLGLEDWSSAGNAAFQSFNSPLLPGVANAPFPNGTNPATGLTVATNGNGANGAVFVAGGQLAFAPAGFEGVSGNEQPSNQVSVNLNSNAFHMAFADVGGEAPAAVSFTPTFYRTTGPNNSGTLTVTVYDGSNALAGTTTVPNVADALETAYLGIVGAPGEIRRINVWAGGNAAAGADNIRVYAPEPAAGAAGAVLAALGGLGWRRRLS